MKRVLALGMLALTACAPDRNLEQFNAGKRREQLQRIQEVSGVYRGEVELSSGRGKTGFQLEISGTIDASGDNPRATVRGSIRVGIANPVQVGFNSAVYDPESHDLVLQLPLELLSGNRDSLLLRGTIEGPVFQGWIGFETHDSGGRAITLVKNAAFSEHLSDISALGTFDRLEGQAWPDDRKPMAVFLSLSEIQVSNQQIMFNILTSNRLMLAVISFQGPEVTYSLTGEYNGNENVLRVSAVLPSPAVLTQLQCSPRDKVWRCLWQTALGSVPLEFARLPFSR